MTLSKAFEEFLERRLGDCADVEKSSSITAYEAEEAQRPRERILLKPEPHTWSEIVGGMMSPVCHPSMVRGPSTMSLVKV